MASRNKNFHYVTKKGAILKAFKVSSIVSVTTLSLLRNNFVIINKSPAAHAFFSHLQTYVAKIAAGKPLFLCHFEETAGHGVFCESAAGAAARQKKEAGR